MGKRLLPAFFLAAFLLILVGFGCTKIDTTSLGSDIVAVDNVNTFADTLSVNATNGIFNDSTVVSKADNQVVGQITSDGLFGTTDARIYAQFKPTFYPFYFGNAGDKVYSFQDPAAGLDSAVVCLSFKGNWGDSSVAAQPQTFEVRQINDEAFRLNSDTLRKLNYPPPAVNSVVLGSAVITPAFVKQRVRLPRLISGTADSVENQIRIPLRTAAGIAFANTFYNSQDSTVAGPNNGLRNDSTFRKKLHGFEIRAVGATGNTLYYINLAEAKSRLEFHYKKVSASGVKDTVYQSFQFYTVSVSTTAASSGTNYLKRDYTGAAIASPAAEDIYLQTSPGTYANISVPGLTNYSNRIVHRAYLVVEQTPDPAATTFSPPPYLYMDLKDTVISTPQRYKPIYFDLSSAYVYNPDAAAANILYHPFPLSNVDISNFGGRLLQRYENGGVPFARYELNVTRYVQHIASNGYRNYDLRLYAPYSYYYPQYSGQQYVIPYYNPLAFGRARVAGGNHPNFAHRMRLVVIYSKI